jgi:Cu-Zn family superoxide dismutase
MLNPSGETIGTASFEETSGGVRLHLTATFLDPGIHGFHIHQGGTCTPPTFESAEGHFNPTGAEHGMDMPGGPHAGDLLNLEVGADGTVEADRTVDGVYLHEGPNSIAGRALVIHAMPDDYMTQPTGAAGGRVACGVITPSAIVDIQ